MRHNNTREHLGDISRPHLDSISPTSWPHLGSISAIYLGDISAVSRQAHARLENVRDAWGAACLARELKPDSAEVKELQLSLQVRAVDMRPRGAITRPLPLDLFVSSLAIDVYIYYWQRELRLLQRAEKSSARPILLDPYSSFVCIIYSGQRELRLLQRAEKSSARGGVFGTDAGATLLQRDERKVASSSFK